MEKKQQPQEKFKTMIGGQALIEGIMMRGPKKDAIVCRQNGELKLDVRDRKVAAKGSVWTWPVLRGVYGFLDAQINGVKALMHSADLSPEEEEQPAQLSFLEESPADDPRQARLAHAMDEVRKRFGKDAIGTGTPKVE